jgi:hypothetical protein
MTDNNFSPTWMAMALELKSQHDQNVRARQAKIARERHHATIVSLTETPARIEWLRNMLSTLQIPARFGRYGKCPWAQCGQYLFRCYSHSHGGNIRYGLSVGIIVPRLLVERAKATNDGRYLSANFDTFPIMWVTSDSVFGTVMFQPWMLPEMLTTLQANLVDYAGRLDARESQIAQIDARAKAEAEAEAECASSAIITQGLELSGADRWLVAELESLIQNIKAHEKLSSAEQAVAAFAIFALGTEERLTF